MKKEVSVDEIARHYEEYRKKFGRCLGQKEKDGRKYCYINRVGCNWFPCKYSDAEYLVEEKKYYCYGCSYEAKPC